MARISIRILRYASPCLLLFFLMAHGQKIGQMQEFYSMNWANFSFPTDEEYHNYVDNELYKHVFVPGGKVDLTGRRFASSPRLWSTVPATFSEVVLHDDGVVKMRPYPNWEWQEIGNETALQSVFGFTIDTLNRLWLIDIGYVTEKPLGNVSTWGPAKIVVFDLFTDTHLFTYQFPKDFAPYPGPNLNDIVVDVHRGFAYISDLSGAVIIFDMEKKTSRRVLAGSKYTSPDPNVWIDIHGYGVNIHLFPNKPLLAGCDGIALSPDGNTLVFSPLTSRSLYKVPTDLLRDFSTPQGKIESAVQTIFSNRTSINDGITFASNGLLYTSAPEIFAVMQVDVDAEKEEILTQSEQFKWPDTFAFSHDGWLIFSSSNIYNVFLGTADWSKPVFGSWGIYLNVTAT